MSEWSILEFEFVWHRWEVSTILSEVPGFIESSVKNKSMLVDRLIFHRDHNLDTPNIESAFFDFLGGAKFQALPIDVFVRVLSADTPPIIWINLSNL
jgi:hypothetical protein